MKKVGYIGSLLPDGHLSISPDVVQDMGLRPDDQVRIVLIPLTKSTNNDHRKAEQTAVWQQVDALRERLSASEFSLADSLLRAREEEDASL